MIVTLYLELLLDVMFYIVNTPSYTYGMLCRLLNSLMTKGMLYYDVMQYVAMQEHARDTHTHLAAAHFHAGSFRCLSSYDLPTMAK